MNKKFFCNIMLSAAALSLTGCADGKISDFFVDHTDSIKNLSYLNEYDALKTYVDRSVNPNFKLAVGVGAQNYVDQKIDYRLANANFDEMTAGNAMKFASCVSDDGTMDFSLVKSFVEAAENANMTVFGHCLAWHSQQNNTFLNNCIADKELPVDPDGGEVTDKQETYSAYTSYPFYVMGYTPTFKNGHMCSSYPGSWYQYFVIDNFASTPGTEYKVTAKLKASKDGTITVQAGNWGHTFSKSMNVSTTMEEHTVSFTELETTSSFVVFQPGSFDGDLEIEYVKVSHGEAASVTYYENQLTNGKMEEDGDMSNFVVREPGKSDVNGQILVGKGPDGKNCTSITSHANPTNTYDTQFFIYTPNKKWAAGEAYKISFWYKATEAATCETQCHVAPGSYKYWQCLSPTPSFTTEWQHYEKTGTIPDDGDGMQSIAFNLNVNKNQVTYYFADIDWSVEKSGNTLPLTDEEKKDTLTKVMNKWVNGMMEACDGKVVAWDVVNEALSGVDKDGDGYYDLQSAKRGTVSDEDAASKFYWQDYLGDIDYVRTAVSCARRYFAAHNGDASKLKLFINDYNLESTWDDNKKMKSLIHWLQKWENDTVKIDGVATQMHITCYENETAQQSLKDHIVKMYELMASTGKLCKVSELDMGYVDADGNTVLTQNITDEQQKKMAELYQFVVEKYFEIIPQAQRYGITQWCITDSESSSGWRGGEPVGLWTTGYDRKRAYGGFADGLKKSNNTSANGTAAQ